MNHKIKLKYGRIFIFLICLSTTVSFIQRYLFSNTTKTGSMSTKENNMNINQNDIKGIYIRIFKEESILELWAKNEKGKYELLKEYDICTYSGGLGPKKKEGDKKSPEGFYATKKSLLNPNSNYHLSFNIGYPNEYDKSHGYTGSFIMIHGACYSIGCYAMTDEKIEEIYSLVEYSLDNNQNNIAVHVFPFKMTNKNMEKYKNEEHYAFWSELKPAYDYFEKNNKEPNIKVMDKKYILVE